MTTLASLLEQSKRLNSSLAAPAASSSSSSGLPVYSSAPLAAGAGQGAGGLAHASDGDALLLPRLQLGLEQIERQSRKLAQRDAALANEADAQYLLASAGVNAPLISRQLESLDPSLAFAPLRPLSDTDVEGHVRHAHEQAIIASVDEARRLGTRSFAARNTRAQLREWEKTKASLFDELGIHGQQQQQQQQRTRESTGGEMSTPKRRMLSSTTSFSSAATPNSGGLNVHAKMMRLDRVVRRLNEYRRDDFSFALCHAFADAERSISHVGGSQGGGGSDSGKAQQLVDTWRLLASITGEHDVADGEFQREAVPARAFARAYAASRDPAAETSEARDTRKRIVSGSRDWLEQQFMAYVERVVASKPLEANLGGVPSVTNKIRAFVQVKHRRAGQWTMPALQLVPEPSSDGTPVYAIIYLLIRAGASKDALRLASEHERALNKNFVAYLRAYVDEGGLSKLLHDRFMAQYNSSIRSQVPGHTIDAYKYALYRLIGRTELGKRNVTGVTSTSTEDWLWFQLAALVREDDTEAAAAADERFGLRELAKVLDRFGEKHFDPKGTRPVLYFQVLLISGQFEKAIAFLCGHAQYQTDAVHYAIALAYYGLVRVAQPGSTTELLVADGGDVARLDFARLVRRYARSFMHTDPQEALSYLYLIALNADLPAPAGDAHLAACHDAVRELVMDTRRYAELIGDVRADGTKVPGMLERDLKLIGLEHDAHSYLLNIVREAARRADDADRFSEALVLYNLAEDYDAVVGVLNAELGAALSRPSLSAADDAGDDSAATSTMGLASASRENVVATAQNILAHYDRSMAVHGRVKRATRETCETLLVLTSAVRAYERGLFARALDQVEQSKVVPLDGDLVAIVRAAEQVPELAEPVVRNLDVVLLATMTSIYRLYNGARDGSSGDSHTQARLLELRKKARALMTFAGMLKFRLTNDTHAALARLDVYIS